MLGIGALRASSAAYYLETVASGREDYYLGAGEAPGVWIGSHATTLGLDGTVEADALHAVLEGRGPHDGTRLGRSGKNRAPGFDLTFSAPKSVSILHALAPAAISAEVRDAHDRAVLAALGWLEQNACLVRRGAGGVRVERGDGFIAAAFRHRTSRAGDPHLHTHVLVANLTRGPEGHWSALDGRYLYALSKTAGYLYEAHLRHDLTTRLGLAWNEVRNGIADVEGIPRALIDDLSQRRHEILERLDTLGWRSARAAQIAALDTRAAKNPDVDVEELRVDCRTIAADHGVTASALESLLERVEHPVVPDERTVESHLLSADGLTAQASTFDRRDVLQAWCSEFRYGAPITHIEALADHTLASAQIVELRNLGASVAMRRGDRRRIAAPRLGSEYSTIELVALEQRLLANAIERASENVATVSRRVALRAHAELSDEQQGLVRALTTSGRGVDVVIAPAGAGKTTALAAARDAWQRAGYHVIGCAVAAKAARQLETTGGIRATTIAALREHLSRGAQFAPHTVLVIDEARMVGTRTLAPLLDAAATTRTKVVLVGDTKQLPEIDAGGLLRALDHHLGGLRLQHNRRQEHAWERDALSQLRDGRPNLTVATYEAHGRVVVAPTAAARARLAADYVTAHRRGERAVMLASRRRDVRDLNRRARMLLVDAGLVSGSVLAIGEREYQCGDRIMTLRNTGSASPTA